jgi:hypothetical protein
VAELLVLGLKAIMVVVDLVAKDHLVLVVVVAAVKRAIPVEAEQVVLVE